MWQDLLEEIKDGQLFLAYEIRSWIDGYRRTGGRIHCDKGCRSCCNLAVNTTFTEALCIAEVLTPDQQDRIDKHVAKLRQHVGTDDNLLTFLRMHRQEIGFCPLLGDDGACEVYRTRPFTCRALLSTRESICCRLDFATLSPEEKDAWLASLDPAVVAFPLHYAAATRKLGEEYEERALRRMIGQFGFSLYGNLPLLLHLERHHRLSAIMGQGHAATAEFLIREGVLHPCLVTLTTAPPEEG